MDTLSRKAMMSLLSAILLTSCVHGLIIPMTNPDGSLDISSLMSHVSLLEQTLESKASTSEMNEVKSQLQETKEEVAVLKYQLSSQCPCNTTQSADLKNLQTDVSNLKTDVFQLKSVHNSTGLTAGATYTRWGKTICPAGQTVIYKGYAAGSHFSKLPSSTTVLCLPEQPIYANHTTHGHNAYVYGSEYEGDAYPSTSHWAHLDDQNIPCVVCQTDSKRFTMMLPGRNKCYPDWNLEYWGYLMGAKKESGSSEILCVDKDAEALPGGGANQNGHALLVMEGVCGSLPCPPYENYWELTCAVCSQ